MNELESKNILTKLLNSFSTKEVQDVVDSCQFGDSDWSPYGGREKNWDTVSAQQTSGVGALAELITNSIDAVLCRKAYESGIYNLSAPDAPQSMQDAVRKFYGVPEGRLSSLSYSERIAIADDSVLIGVKRAKRSRQTPTITVVDYGEGQHPEKFEKTFLSLGEKNKEGIGFVQGKFNMGSTGSLAFCTKSDLTLGHYKLIVSKRYDSDIWGWTIVRVFKVEEGNELPIVKFLKPAGEIPHFRTLEKIHAFGENYEEGAIDQGSIVRLFDYVVEKNAHKVNLGLFNALSLKLLDCALPVRMYDFDAKPIEGQDHLREKGIVRNCFSGLNTMLLDNMKNAPNQDAEIKIKKPGEMVTEFIHLVSVIDDREFGEIRIIATGVSGLISVFENEIKRIFYTINGQTHHSCRASFLNLKDVSLGDLQNNLIVNIECEAMDKTALATIFSGNREQAKKTRLFEKLEKCVKNALAEDSKLRAYQTIIKNRRVAGIIDNSFETKKLLSDFIAKDPNIRALLGFGDIAKASTQVPGGFEIWNEGKKYPTYLRPLNLSKDDNGACYVKRLPINGRRKIVCATDAANDYLSRTNSPGRRFLEPPISIDTSYALHNGRASFTFDMVDNDHYSVGDKIAFAIGFDDDGGRDAPLTFPLILMIAEAEKINKGKSGKKTESQAKEKESVADPTEWIVENDWRTFGFNENSGATVRDADSITVYVNKDHYSLKEMRKREKDEARRVLNENRYRVCLGFLTLAVYRHATHDGEDDKDYFVDEFSNAISPYILSIVTALAEEDFNLTG